MAVRYSEQRVTASLHAKDTGISIRTFLTEEKWITESRLEYFEDTLIKNSAITCVN